MASIHPEKNKTGTVIGWRVKWREHGRQRSLSFEDSSGAVRFKTNLEQHGPDEACRILEVEDTARSAPTVTEFITTYIDGLTGVQPATLNRYRAYLDRDITPAFGSMPVPAVTEAVIGRWVQAMAQPKKITRKGPDGKPVEKTVTPARKTLKNKHAFLSGVFKTAVKQGIIGANPCEGRRLPETPVMQKVFLTPGEFQMIWERLPHQRWKNLAVFLVLTGLRFSEAAALTPRDIDVAKKTCRVHQAWKYSGTYNPTVGAPKSAKSVRTVSLPDAALAALDLTEPEWLFTNNAGNSVRAQDFFKVWKPARDAAMAAGLTKCPRVHDLRHTHVSWLIEEGVHLAVIQKRLGHESIKTTIDVYGELDQSSDDAAALTLGNRLRAIPAATG